VKAEIVEVRSAGDLIIIGEKGVNLSGGQKARISLARALYNDADIYLFDDPLAAVDSNVARKIFKYCISNEGILNNKTRLLVTRQIQFLSEFDHCILLNHSQIEKQGTFYDLLTLDKIKETYYTNKAKERHDSIVDDSIGINRSKITDEKNIIKEETSFTGNVSI
jgi:ABC-type multidrug transport system fused ATPase/permease subunit